MQDPNPWTAVAEQYRPPEIYVQQPPTPPKPKYWLHSLLFLLTVISTWGVGTLSFGPKGWIFSASLLAILTSHEFGHYFAAKYHRVPASLPYFIPLPLPPFGTMGAVIRMSPRIPNRRVLFDIAAAGPIAGLVVALPITFVGITLSNIILKSAVPAGSLSLSEPLLFKGLGWLAHGTLGDNMDVMLHPLAFAGWAGMFVTALNLLPISQLDGGHISHALLAAQSRWIAFSMYAGLLGFSLVRHSYDYILILVLLLLVGLRHPRTMDDERALGVSRTLLGILLGIVFLTCFSLIPIS
jgi:membrane-associated protease RseP (regulator of RpoE activity)